MRRRLRFWAFFFVGLGAFYAFTGRHRDFAPALLVLGIVLAVAYLLLDLRRRR